MVSADVRRSIFCWDMNIFRPTRRSCVTKGLMTGLSCVMTYNIFGRRAQLQGFDTWKDEQREHQPRLPGDQLAPHICDGWHRLDEALLLCILPCAQIWVVPKILRNCQMVGVVRLTWRGQVQVVVAAAKLAVGGSCKKDAKLRAGLMEAYLCDEPFRAVFFPFEIRLIEGFNEACSLLKCSLHIMWTQPYHYIMMHCNFYALLCVKHGHDMP